MIQYCCQRLSSGEGPGVSRGCPGGEGPYTILYSRRKLKNVIIEKGGSPCSFLWRSAVLRSHQVGIQEFLGGDVAMWRCAAGTLEPLPIVIPKLVQLNFATLHQSKLPKSPLS